MKELKIKSELHIVYITSDHKKFAYEEDAVARELRIQSHKDSKRKDKEHSMELAQLVMEVLKENGWGVYHKVHPIQSLDVKDGTPLFRVNSVDEEMVESRLLELINKIKDESNKWKKQSLQNDSNQNQDSETG